MALEQISFNIGAFNDANAGGNNYFTDIVFEVKNQSDSTFATIYADSSGTTLIPQNGIDNVSNSRGECNFYIGEGEFYIEVGSQKKNFRSGGDLKYLTLPPYEVPPFNGSTIQLPFEATNFQVEVDGRILPPSFYTIVGNEITLTVDISDDQVVVVRASLLSGASSGGSSEKPRDFNDVSQIKLIPFTDIQEGAVLTTREFYEGLGYGGAAYDVLSEANMQAAGYLPSGLDYTHFEIGTSGLYACLRFNKSITLDKIGAKKSDPTFDNKPVHDAAVALTDVIYLTGDYYASNIVFPIKELTYRGIGNGYCKFKALNVNDYDSEYFAAPKTWLDNSSSCNPPITTESVGFDGGNRDYALVVHWYFGNHENLFVDNGSTNAVLMTALNRDGSAISSTMVNNRFRNVWIEGGANIGFQVTEDGKTTDWELVGGYIFNDGSIGGASSSVNISVATCAGATISGIHGYAADRNLSISKWSTGTRVFGNYFENDVQIRQGLNDTYPLIFGPNNTINGDLELLFGVVSGPVRSEGNFYNGKVIHDYFGDKKFFSTNDNYIDASPFVWTSTNPANLSSFQVLHANIGSESLSGYLSPGTSTDISTLKNDFDADANPTITTEALVNLNFNGSTIPANGEVRSLIPFDGSDLASQNDVFICAIKGLPEGVSQSVYYDQTTDNKWKIKLVNTTSSVIEEVVTTAIVTKFN